VKQACQRQLDDLARQGWQFYFDREAANRVCDFVCSFPHIKGPLAGLNITLEPWQSFILTAVFGWLRVSNGKRRFRRVYIEVPRGNGKTTISAGPGLYMLAADKEGGAEVFSAARTRDQAKIAFGLAQMMARKCPDFTRSMGVEVVAHRIIQQHSASFFEAVSADADSLDGKNVHFGLIDELHAHRSRDVYDAIETGAGKRDQSLLWAITTAGSDKTGIAYEQRAFVLNILKKTVQDENYFGMVYTIDEGDDWTAEATWRKANPNFGVSVEAEHLAAMCRKAMQSPASQAAFLTKHLNVWIQTDQALYDTQAWARCANPALDIDDFIGKRCRIACDLASKIDIAAVAILFEGDEGEPLAAFTRFYVPEAAIEETRNASYQGWAFEGHLITTPGDVIDFATIESDLVADLERFDVIEIGFDPWQSTQMATSLGVQGANVSEFRQVVANFSEPTKELDAIMRKQELQHDGNPVLSWMIGNVVGHYDAKENVYPRKERPENKIDGAVALIMALGLRMKNEAAGPSVYEQRGLIDL
jgi:phage terminase large subunit-like protein